MDRLVQPSSLAQTHWQHPACRSRRPISCCRGYRRYGSVTHNPWSPVNRVRFTWRAPCSFVYALHRLKSAMQSTGSRTFDRHRARPAHASLPSLGWIVFLILVVSMALGGGSSKTFIASLLYVRPVAILCLGVLLITPVQRNWRGLKSPALLLLLFAIWMCLQLVPLPPTVWSMLPGHAPFLEASAAIGAAPPWRPLTLNIDLTLASLFTLAPAAAVIVAYAGFTSQERARTVPTVLAIVASSALVALIQVAGGENSAAYLYTPTSRDLPVGLLANRNHQAALLALGLPVLTLWLRNSASQHQQRRRPRPVERVSFLYSLGAVTAIIFVLIALVSGSRAGLILCTGGLITSALLFGRSILALNTRKRWMIVSGSLAALLVVLLLAVIMGRALVLDRLDTTGISSDQRFRAFPVLVKLIRTYFPFGSGMGTFDPVFRMFEPDADLDRGFFNNAHNDLIELVITGGLPALTLLMGLVAWLSARLIAAIRIKGAADAVTTRGWVGLSVIVLLMAASLFDYPLRTPLLSMVFAIACCWASALGHAANARDAGPALVERD